MSFDIEVQKILAIEGAYSNNKNDAGGETNFGIDEQTARSHGYTGAISAMPKSFAISVYKSDFYDKAGCGIVSAYSDMLSDDLFETGVNIGVQTAGRILQRAVNAISYQTMPKILVDGNVGTVTGSAIGALYKKRGTEGLVVLRGMFLSLISYRYISIAETTPTDEEFEYGWQLNRVIGAP